MGLTLTMLYYISMLAYYPILGVLLVIPYMMGVSLVVLLSVVLVRDDLVADLIARLSRPPSEPRPKKVRDRVDATAWKDEAAAITSIPMPPTLWIQMIINRARQYETEQLAPLNKRLAALTKRFEEVDKETRRTRTELVYGIRGRAWGRTRVPYVLLSFLNRSKILLDLPVEYNGAEFSHVCVSLTGSTPYSNNKSYFHSITCHARCFFVIVPAILLRDL